MKTRIFLILGASLALAACATAPKPLQGQFSTVSPRDSVAQQQTGTPVRWGGRIIETLPGLAREAMQDSGFLLQLFPVFLGILQDSGIQLSQLLQMVFSPDGPDDILLGTSAPTHHADADEELLGAPIDDKKAPANGAINEDMASLDELLNQLVDTDDAEEAKDNDEE